MTHALRSESGLPPALMDSAVVGGGGISLKALAHSFVAAAARCGDPHLAGIAGILTAYPSAAAPGEASEWQRTVVTVANGPPHADVRTVAFSRVSTV